MPQDNGIADSESLLAGLLRWVEFETPTGRVDVIGKLLDHIVSEASPLGCGIERIAGRDGMGDHLILRFAGGPARGILCTNHLDTVCTPGSVPMRRDGDRFHGPGIADMKGGAYLAFSAIRNIVRSGQMMPGPLTLVFNTDEEIGSPTSRAVIQDEARKVACALIPEPARGDEAITFRKGRAKYRIDITGREAHAGSAFADGRSAISEMARTIVALDEMTDISAGTTVNVGYVSGGTEPNVVAGKAHCLVDVRFSENDAGHAVEQNLRRLAPRDPQVRIDVAGEIEKPCLDRSADTLDLFRHAEQIAREIGPTLVETSSGGGSDGNFTSAAGTPTLDGLGAIGNFWHSPNEHIIVSALARRELLLRRLFLTLGG
ncbi:M20 family metallopeptidase [Rhizobium puerariae]|uniref:M20 family metallopeptidase n=2 Tax=Rhizobium puerariae TaxID=1585791 RepID=A0ABV6AEL5_9HYPH